MPAKKEKKIDCAEPNIPEDVCSLDNPFQDMFDYQDQCIEREQPFVQPLWNAIMWAGDVYRGTSERVFPYGYVHEKVGFLNRVNDWGDYEISHILEDFTPDKVEQLEAFRQKLNAWEQFTKEHPNCDMPIRRKLQLKAIEVEKLLTDFGLAISEISKKPNALFVTELFQERFEKLYWEMENLFKEADKQEETPP